MKIAQIPGPRHAFVKTAAILCTLIASSLLAGCETGGSVFGGGGQPPNPQLAQPVAPAEQPARARVALAPVIGAPEALSKQISTQLTELLERQRVVVTKSANEPSDYTLRGYVVAVKDKAGAKVTHIWDVTNATGARVNRITGEEVVPVAAGGNAWSGVTGQVTQTIAERTVTSFVAWLPAGGPQPPVAPVADARTVAPIATNAVQDPAAGRIAPVPAALGTTGSIARGVSVVVPRVTGAPGDGSQALASALQRELTRNGIALANAPEGQAHRVEGRVVLGKAQKVNDDQGARDVQPITIDWVVKDPKGASIGTVTQKNDIKPGELDGTWGKTADAAAAAAAQGILKLLQQTTTN